MFASQIIDAINLIQDLIHNYEITIEEFAGKEEILDSLIAKAKSAGIKVMVEQRIATGTYNYNDIDRAFKTELVRLIKAA